MKKEWKGQQPQRRALQPRLFIGPWEHVTWLGKMQCGCHEHINGKPEDAECDHSQYRKPLLLPPVHSNPAPIDRFSQESRESEKGSHHQPRKSTRHSILLSSGAIPFLLLRHLDRERDGVAAAQAQRREAGLFAAVLERV